MSDNRYSKLQVGDTEFGFVAEKMPPEKMKGRRKRVLQEVGEPLYTSSGAGDLIGLTRSSISKAVQRGVLTPDMYAHGGKGKDVPLFKRSTILRYKKRHNPVHKNEYIEELEKEVKRLKTQVQEMREGEE